MFWHVVYLAVAVILLFSVTIFIHELGHFLAARWFGMVVEVFSIGFGPALWKKKIRGVVYKIGWIPVGGYVALPQMDPTLDNSAPPAAAAPGAIPPVAPWKKIIVSFAGAAGNVLLAILLAWIVYAVGKPSTPAERSSMIGFVETNSAAYAQGLRPGDEIIAVNGQTICNWHELIQECARFEEVTLTMKTAAGPRAVRLLTEKTMFGFRMLDGLREMTLCRVMTTEPGSSAALAGLQNGDLIRQFDGIKVLSIEHLIALVGAAADRSAPLQIDRNGQTLTLSVTPKMDAALGRARIGIRFDLMAVDYDQVVHIPPRVQLESHATAILRVVRALLTPKEARNTSQGLGGPIMILYMLVDMVRKGLIVALWFTCFLNVNLAILNLLPIPILDGGHILFALVELVTRRPVPPKLVNGLSQIFAGLLIAVFVLLTGRDVMRLSQLRKLMKPPPAQEQVTNAPGATVNSNSKQSRK